MKYYTKLSLKTYWQHTRPFRPMLVLLVVSVCLHAVTNMLAPIFYSDFFNVLTQAPAVRQQVRPMLLHLLFIIGLLALANEFFLRVAGFANNYLQPHVTAELGKTCFAYIHKHSFHFFSDHFIGSLVKQVNRFMGAYEAIADRLTWDFLPLVTNVIVILIVLTSRYALLGGILFIWIILFVSVTYALTRYKLKYDVERSLAETKVSAVLADTLTNHANVKLFVGQAREEERYGSAVEQVRRLQKFTWDLDNYFEAIKGLLMVGLEVGLFYLAIGLWERGILTTGDFVLIQSYLISIFIRIWDFGRIIRTFYERLADAEEMMQILDTPHDVHDRPQAKPLVVQTGKIECRDVRFNYRETRGILEHFSLTIAPKEKLALVGPSGAGKSTIVKILLRQYDVTEGKVLIDGQLISQVTQDSLWEAISLVPQEPILFHRTLMDNIRYGKPDATDEQVVVAATLAHCHEFILSFPDGYDTFVGERGVKLSGGERQRVAIARAILRNAPILILDEATSSLDSESESLIQDALKNLMRGKTVIVIAHRLSTIMNMDRIVVLDNGKIVEEGTHAALLKQKKGLYQRLWQLQAGGFISS